MYVPPHLAPPRLVLLMTPGHSIGINGETFQLRRMLLFLYFPRLGLILYNRSVWIRRTERQGVFNIMIGGREVDISALAADHEAIWKFIRDTTNHQELEFGELTWISEFRYAARYQFQYSSLLMLHQAKYPNGRQVQ